MAKPISENFRILVLECIRLGACPMRGAKLKDVARLYLDMKRQRADLYYFFRMEVEHQDREDRSNDLVRQMEEAKRIDAKLALSAEPEILDTDFDENLH